MADKRARSLADMAGRDGASLSDMAEPGLESRRLEITGNPEFRDNPIYKVLRYFAKDPSSALPSPAAIAVLPETLPLFTKAMEEAKGPTGHELIDKAMAFLQTRYPRFASQARVYAANPGQMAANVYGSFGHAEQPYVRVNPYAYGGSMTLSDYVKTLAHEMTHARQSAKGPADVLVREAAAGVPYLEREIEKGARRAGMTATDAYAKYLNLIDPPAPEPLNWETFVNVVSRK